MLTLFGLLARLPLWLLHAVGAPGGWLTFLLSPTYRRRFIDNAAQAGYTFADVAGAVGQAGRMALETPRLWSGRTSPIEWRDLECLEAALQSGRGVLFLTPHLGCYEVTAQAVAARYMTAQQPLTVLYRPARKAWLSGVMQSARQRPELVAAPTTLAGVRQLIRALRQGAAVGLLPDQVPPEGMGQWTSWFGKPAYTITLSARLALQTGATLVLVFGERLSWGRGYRLHFRPLSRPLAPNLDAALLQINEAVEALIRECPQQYLWGYGRYKQPRRVAAVAPAAS
ncbi:MAG: lysophospholipid acyltransferase family protein [Burkholderiales bacterium]